MLFDHKSLIIKDHMPFPWLPLPFSLSGWLSLGHSHPQRGAITWTDSGGVNQALPLSQLPASAAWCGNSQAFRRYQSPTQIFQLRPQTSWNKHKLILLCQSEFLTQGNGGQWFSVHQIVVSRLVLPQSQVRHRLVEVQQPLFTWRPHPTANEEGSSPDRPELGAFKLNAGMKMIQSTKLALVR